MISPHFSGWSAHIMEQRANNRLIRPDAEYIGPSPRSFPTLETTLKPVARIPFHSPRAQPDRLLEQIADYVCHHPIQSETAYQTARYCLMDTLGCGLMALQYPACTKLLGPVVPGTIVPNGARVPGTAYELDPVTAAFNIGCAIRWLDFNDTWLAAEWGHPSDNLGAILAVADFLSRRNLAEGKAPLTIRDLLAAMIKAHEIQGVRSSAGK